MISVKIRYLVIGVGIINKKHTLLHKVHILAQLGIFTS